MTRDLSEGFLEVLASRLLQRLAALGEIGDTGDGGSCRLALTDADRHGRDVVTGWMRKLDLEVSIDGIGNVCAVQPGFDPDLAPVVCGSHIDTVATGGRYDGNLGVLAGLAVIEAVERSGTVLPRPLGVALFTNEEGARFAPDMLGSLVYAGGLSLETALETVAIDGARLGDELARIGYAGSAPCPGRVPHAYVELHIEQGPALERAGVTIGAVTGVQGISWTELNIAGQSNHAGTTPMALRHDAGYVAAAIATFVRQLADELGPPQVATVGRVELRPNLVNVVAASASITVDLRNTDDAVLDEAERRLTAEVERLAAAEGVEVSSRRLARFAPVDFDERVISTVEEVARRQGRSVMRLPSGAGHDAQMLARVCPSGMIFVPSIGGISHNPAERTEPEDLVAGAAVLAAAMIELASAERR